MLRPRMPRTTALLGEFYFFTQPRKPATNPVECVRNELGADVAFSQVCIHHYCFFVASSSHQLH